MQSPPSHQSYRCRSPLRVILRNFDINTRIDVKILRTKIQIKINLCHSLGERSTFQWNGNFCYSCPFLFCNQVSTTQKCTVCTHTHSPLWPTSNCDQANTKLTTIELQIKMWMSSFFRRWTSYTTQAGGLCKTGCEPSILGEMKWKLLAQTSKEISPWNGRPGGWENPKWGVTGWVGRFLGKFEVFGDCGEELRVFLGWELEQNWGLLCLCMQPCVAFCLQQKW